MKPLNQEFVAFSFDSIHMLVQAFTFYRFQMYSIFQVNWTKTDCDQSKGVTFTHVSVVMYSTTPRCLRMSVGGLMGKPHLENKCIPSLYHHVRGRALLRAINHCVTVCGMRACIRVSSCSLTPAGFQKDNLLLYWMYLILHYRLSSVVMICFASALIRLWI